MPDTDPDTTRRAPRPLLVDAALIAGVGLLLGFAWNGEWPARPADLGDLSRQVVERHVGRETGAGVVAAVRESGRDDEGPPTASAAQTESAATR